MKFSIRVGCLCIIPLNSSFPMRKRTLSSLANRVTGKIFSEAKRRAGAKMRPTAKVSIRICLPEGPTISARISPTPTIRRSWSLSPPIAYSSSAFSRSTLYEQLSSRAKSSSSFIPTESPLLFQAFRRRSNSGSIAASFPSVHIFPLPLVDGITDIT